MDELVHPNPDVIAVDVHKRRERYTVGGCLAEVTEVRSGQRIDPDDRDRVRGRRRGNRARSVTPAGRRCPTSASRAA